MYARLQPAPHGDLRLAGTLVCLSVSEDPPVEERDDIGCLHQPAGVARREVQGIDNPREPATSITLSPNLPITGQVGPVLRLPVDLVCDDERILPVQGRTLIHAFEKMLQHDRVRRIGGTVASTLADDVHRPSDDYDFLSRYRFDDIVEDTHASTDRHASPCSGGMEDLMSMKFHR